MLIDAEFDLAALDIADGLAHIDGHGAGLGVGHQATWAEHLAERADLAHQIGGGDHGIEIGPAALDLLQHVVRTDVVGSRCTGLVGLLSIGEHQHTRGLAGAMRQVDGAAHHLVGLAGVDAQPHRDLNGRVELGRVGVLHQPHRGER